MAENSNQHSSKSFWGRFVIYIILVLIVLVLIIQALFTFIVEPALKNKIESALGGKSTALTARVENIKLSLFQRQLRLENVTLFRKDSLQPSPDQPFLIDSLSVPSATISGVQILPFLFNNNLKISTATAEQPFLRAKASIPSSGKIKKQRSEKFLYERIHSFIDLLEVDEFSLTGFSAIITDSLTSNVQIASVRNFNLRFFDIRIDSTSPHKKWLPSPNFEGSLDSLQWKSSSGMYRFQAGHLNFSAKDSLLQIDHFRINPLYPKYKFSRIIGHEIDRIKLQMDSITTRAFNLPALIEQQKILATSVTAQNSSLDIFRNRKLPTGKKRKKTLPHILFRRLQVPVKIDSIIIINADISYSEHKKEVPKPGTVTFENTGAVIRNLNNTSQKEAITINATSKVMGTGVMKVDFSFPPNPSGTHYINGHVGHIDMKAFNPALKYLALVQITNGKIDSINFKMELRPQQSTGALKMSYSNFHIKLLDFGEKGNKDEDTFKSFLTNTFVVNEKDQPPLEEAEISFERIPHKGAFNYWWKSLLSGLKNSLGL